MSFSMSPFPLRFGSRQGGGGDPTAITPANADAFLASLGLTQAGTGTTWGETGQMATPLYPVAAAKVPLAVETIGGNQYFGPIVNPAGTNLALRDRNATQSAWSKTGCTAALALGGLEHGPEWRGEQAVRNSEFDVDAEFTKGTGWTIAGGNAVAANVSSISILQQDDCFTAGKFYLVEYSVQSTTGGFAAYLGSNGNGDCVVDLLAGAGSVVVGALGTDLYIRTGYGGSSNNVTINYFRATEVDAHTLITSSSDNATAVTSITSTSGERVTKWWVQTEDEDVFVSHGAPTGSAPYEDDFSSDTSGEWARALGSVDGTIAVTSGVLTYTIGSNDTAGARITRAITGLVVGKIYRLVAGTVAGTMTNRALEMRDASSGGGTQWGSSLSSGGSIYFQAQATTGYLSLRGITYSVGETMTLDDVSIYEVSETELTPSANPVPVDLDAATFANPQLGIRLANNGDSVRLYGTQHQVAARPLRPYIGPTTSSTGTSGGRSLRRTLGADITEVNISVVVPKNIGVIFRCHEVAGYQGSVYLYRFGDKYTLSNVRGSSLGGFVQGAGAIDVGAGDHDKIDVEYNDTSCRFRVNNGSWTSVTRYGIPGSRVVGIGTDWQGNGAAYEPVLAFRDNIGNLLDGNRGWNHRLLDNWA